MKRSRQRLRSSSPVMNEARARTILAHHLRGDELRCGSPWVDTSPHDGDVVLDGTFSPDELEAMAWWLRNKETTT